MADSTSGTPDIDKLDAIASKNTSPSNENPSDSFKQHMESSSKDEVGSKAPTPMDIVSAQKISPSTPPTAASIASQINAASSTLGDIKQHLSNKDLALKSSDKYLVRKKLSSAQEHITTATKKLGVESSDFDQKLNRSKNPIARFLSMVTDGQNQMAQAAEQVKQLNTKEVNAADLLLVQVKLSKAQQELNYTSTILGNATGMIKTLFNTQV